MAKVQGYSLKIEDIGNFQEIKGKSLIHRCCGKGMLKVQNHGEPLIECMFFVCSEDCGKTELPYLSQLLRQNPEDFYFTAKVEKIV